MRERGLKLTMVLVPVLLIVVAPVRERGLKYHRAMRAKELRTVAPVRERGLKYIIATSFLHINSRSREGAWIEIAAGSSAKAANRSLP